MKLTNAQALALLAQLGIEIPSSARPKRRAKSRRSKFVYPETAQLPRAERKAANKANFALQQQARRAEQQAAWENFERITVRENVAKGGYEIGFPSKPTDTQVVALKSVGARFHFGLGYWWAKKSPEVLAMFTKLANGQVK